MTIESPLSFSKIIGLIFATIMLSILTSSVIYLLKRMWRKKKSKLIWTPISSVDRRSNLSYDEFVREYASIGKPVIITDVVKNWKCSTKWTVDFFRSEYGSAVGQVLDCDTLTKSSMTIADYLDYMTLKERDKLLCLERLLIQDYPELREDYKIPVYFPDLLERIPEKLRRKYKLEPGHVLIGHKDTSIGLHCDSGHENAWVAVISGKKRAVLFSPDQQDFLYDGEVDTFNPDLERFPLYKNANPVECTLNQGEIIYIPPDWWHHVKNIEEAITLQRNSVDQWNSELVFQSFIEADGIKGHLVPLIIEFPWLGSFLFAIGLL
ncbi:MULTISPECIES: cupin-like domain-containing protein [Nostoc]|uniref:Cupin-like domain-containing protein n=1 Tax=Nostoc punctiforme FACHB-252 TaxID=1357509 RepID=A0ABR8HJI0_NOSPU|nr:MULTISPECIES: cupin-like domain-containing protein [Nostoc]MBC1236340.1 cupin-like domain-containing protein [Nostoc sp. 2RC]MBD2615683.1 cupin-like domain-containing protein [Nostoc punctiforme FACHB-252]